MLDEIILSFCLVTYNHEKYIEECVEHILSQRINFKMEILIGNDCSKDATAQLIEERFGDKVTLINRKENVGLCANLYDLFVRARGKYVYMLGGDDYIKDEYMLQKQVDFLESHPEYFSATSRSLMYNEKEGTFRECRVKWGDYTIIDYLSGEKPLYIHGTMRNVFKEEQEKNWFLKMGARNNEEIKMWLYTLDKGKKYIFEEYMIVYRFVTEEGASNYNSTKTLRDMFEDYYGDLRLMEKYFGKKYRLKPCRLILMNKYCVMMSDSLKSLWEFAKVVSFTDMMSLLWYKLYLKAHDYKMPGKWKNPSYLLKTGVDHVHIN